jgi:hypothetical protein
MNKNNKSSTSKVGIYGIVGKKCQRFEYAPPAPHVMAVLWPLLDRCGGAVPTTPSATFEIQESAQSARVFFRHSGELVAACAIVMGPVEESRSLWAWVIEAVNPPCDRTQHELPDEPAWAALALSPNFARIAGEEAYALSELFPTLVAGMVAWMARKADLEKTVFRMPVWWILVAEYDQLIAILEFRLKNKGQKRRGKLANDLAIAYLKKANLLYTWGDNQGAIEVCDQVIAMLEHLVKQKSKQDRSD